MVNIIYTSLNLSFGDENCICFQNKVHDINKDTAEYDYVFHILNILLLFNLLGFKHYLNNDASNLL